MLKTKITDLLGIRYPILGGGMMHLSTADFTAAISEAGGLGILASAIYQNRESFSDALDRLLTLTDQPFGVNLNLFPAMRPVDNDEYLDVILEKGIKVVETSGHSAPEALCARFKEAGLIWIHKCVGVRYGLKVQGMGADVVTVVGYENGGATGKLDVGTLVLTRRAVDCLAVPVIAGGGVTDGRGLAAILSLGAEGVIMGTRLLATQEAPLHDHVKQGLVHASELDTMLVMRSLGATHRVWKNAAALKCAELESKQAERSQILDVVSGVRAKEMYREGDLGIGIMSCGQGVGMVHDIPTVKALFERIMSEATHVIKTLAAD